MSRDQTLFAQGAFRISSAYIERDSVPARNGSSHTRLAEKHDDSTRPSATQKNGELEKELIG